MVQLGKYPFSIVKVVGCPIVLSALDSTRMLSKNGHATVDASRLNLTAANHVFLMEPQWNPMIEDQALDRVYRIGQQKEVTTTRYIVKKSLEEVY